MGEERRGERGEEERSGEARRGTGRGGEESRGEQRRAEERRGEQSRGEESRGEQRRGEEGAGEEIQGFHRRSSACSPYPPAWGGCWDQDWVRRRAAVRAGRRGHVIVAHFRSTRLAGAATRERPGHHEDKPGASTQPKGMELLLVVPVETVEGRKGAMPQAVGVLL
jgi:hypothetical protein